MKMNTYTKARWFALAAGAMDFATGAGLVCLPGFTLGAMQVAAPGAEASVFLGWVGAFVGAVGASYLVTLARGGTGRLRDLFVLTILFRAAAGGYCAVAVARGELEARWVAVAVTDLALVAGQAWFLKRKEWSDER
jgi:hypothetical protein